MRRMDWIAIAVGTIGIIGLLHIFFAHAHASSPLIADTKVDGTTITVGVAYDADQNNEDVTTAVTALDTVPAEWAAATVYHVWYITPQALSFDDVWPNMKAGHFRVQVTLHRDSIAIPVPPVTVEVK